MIVLILSKCPAGLRGDVTKWLLEVNTGIYVGELSARVRDFLWKRVCKHCGTGEATMVFSSRNEQGFSFYVFNTTWKPVDFDGIVLLKKPLPLQTEPVSTKSTTGMKNSNRKEQATSLSKDIKLQVKPTDITDLITNRQMPAPKDFVVIDLETTGLKSGEDSIIELAAARYKQGNVIDQYQALVKYEKSIPENITKLTGIDNELLEKRGQPIDMAVGGFLDFVGNDILVGHYISFDMLFLQKTCCRLNMAFKEYQVIDTVALAKAFFTDNIANYRLETLVKTLGIAEGQEHRALPDAILAAILYLKLNEI